MSKKTLKFHPLSEVYRLMDSNELIELAEDIKENGLLEPIVLHQGKILDGRNRYLACREAKIEPESVEWSGECETAEAYVLAKHTRRNVTAGQHAMAVARMWPDTQQGTKRTSLSNHEVSDSYVRMARAVLREAPDLADSVTVGPTTLAKAYATVKERRAIAQSEHAQMSRLRQQAPDLAELTQENRMSLSEALSALRQREEDLKQRERIVADSLYGIAQGWSHITGLAVDPARDGALEILDSKTRSRILEIEKWAQKTK